MTEQAELDCFIKEHLKTRCIHPSKPLIAFPCFFIKKKDGLLHLVQDYQTLNAITIKNRYLLLLISELVNKLWKAKYFTKLDICWDYNNVQIKEGDEWKTAFQCNHGLFEPIVIIFRLINSPATFQITMNEIFADLIAKNKVCVYIDDILIYSVDLVKHLWITDMVLVDFKNINYNLKSDKCKFE